MKSSSGELLSLFCDFSEKNRDKDCVCVCVCVCACARARVRACVRSFTGG